MIASGQWLGDGRRSSTTALNALFGLIVFGYPGFMYAVFGRFTWLAESEMDDYNDAGTPHPDSDPGNHGMQRSGGGELSREIIVNSRRPLIPTVTCFETKWLILPLTHDLMTGDQTTGDMAVVDGRFTSIGTIEYQCLNSA